MINLGFAVGFALYFAFTTAFAQPADPRVVQMTLEQKVGQLMIWSFEGTELTPAFTKTLAKYQPGAVIYFRRNISTLAQVAKLNLGLQRLADTRFRAPLFTMIDQEGGLVTRIRTATPLPSALALARMDDPAFVRTFAAQSAELLKEVGFNVNLAPVLDISSPLHQSFIGNRTFGSDPERVAAMTDAFALGLSDAGMMPTAKHFPGHGGTTQNSHLLTPKRMITLKEMHERDLVPFEGFANTDSPRAVMMAHLSLPNIDPSGLPATFSPTMIQGQLRDSLGYRGLVITDDLEMSGAAFVPDHGERAVRAFLAGNDMLMFAGAPLHQRQAFDAVMKAVRDGRITTARLDESVARILHAKGGLAPSPKTFEVANVRASLKQLDELSRQVLKRNFVEASAHAHHAWPEYAPTRVVSVLSGSSLFYRKFHATYPGAARFRWLTKENLSDTAKTLASNDEYAVYFASGQTSARWLNALPRALKSKFIVVNCNEPAEIADQDAFLSVFNVNSYFTDGAGWLGELLKPQAPDATVRALASPPR